MQLGPEGYLPEGRHPVTASTMKQVFVDGFPTSAARQGLFDDWLRHRAALASMISIEAQWIDGSFVTAKLDPGDIDVVTVLDGPTFDGLSGATQSLIAAMLSGPNTKAAWSMDSYAVLRYPNSHPGHQVELDALSYWDDWWGKVRNSSVRKGYLEVTT